MITHLSFARLRIELGLELEEVASFIRDAVTFKITTQY